MKHVSKPHLLLLTLVTSGLLTSCVNFGKDLHTERAMQECREEIGDDRRKCEIAVKEDRYQREMKEKWKKSEKDKSDD